MNQSQKTLDLQEGPPHSPGPWVNTADIQPSLEDALSLGTRAVSSEGQEEGKARACQGTWNRVGHKGLVSG